MSTLRVDNIENSSGSSSPITIPGTAKAWVNFDGTGTVAIRGSYNVSSITDNGAGLYTVNFTNSFADANYSATLNSDDNSGNNAQLITFRSATASTLLIGTWQSAVGRADAANCHVAVFR